MIRQGETLEESEDRPSSQDEAAPGLVMVYAAGAPALRAIALRGRVVEIGRGRFGDQELDDERMSRKHARVSFDGSRWKVVDQESRNGTFVDGVRVQGEHVAEAPRVVRLGRSLFLPVADVRPFLGSAIERRGATVLGPRMRAVYEKIERAAKTADVLLVSGESGAGKELAARAFHASGAHAEGPFVAVNCATIQEGLAERVLFGARRGAYTGADKDADGLVQNADGGTLFLDEVAELEPAVQAKLLRVLETKEVLPLGATKSRAVDVRVVSATRDLRAAVSAGDFREDLYFRIGRPEVTIPPLRERAEEIPWLVAGELANVAPGLAAQAAFVEACLLRTWPGNVRELRAEARRAGHDAVAAGRNTVEATDLEARAGVGFETTAGPSTTSAPAAPPTREAIEEALRAEGGNVTRAARALGMHRNQLRRWLAKNALDPKTLVG